MIDCWYRVHAFQVSYDDGPIVTATRSGDQWNLVWKGGSALVPGPEDEARVKAEWVAREMRELQPMSDELDRRREALGAVLHGEDA